jgi:hypothetical protein
MVFLILFTIAVIIIAVLVLFIMKCLQTIRDLEETLAEEKRKRSMPLLTLEVNTEDDFGAFLINDSYCYAKNITIDDLDVVVDYGFKKHITLKFEPLEMLKPNARSKLNYRVFDGAYDITSSDSTNILNHFSDAPIEMHLRYENIEGGPFKATIVPERDQYVVKEVIPEGEEDKKESR